MNLENRVNAAGSKINKTSVPPKKGHAVGRPSKYGQTTPLKQISENQIVRGEITDLRNREITITLPDSTTITGRFSNGSMFSIGDAATFKITSLSPQITLEALTDHELLMENTAILKALEAAGLPKTEKNMTVVRELIDNNMPINKQSIQMILKQAYEFKDASIHSLILMNRHNIPLTEENAAQFEKYQKLEHPLSTGISSLASSLPALLHGLADKSPAGAAASFGVNLLNILLPGNSADPLPARPNLLGLSMQEREELITVLSPDRITPDEEAFIRSGEMPLKDALRLLESLENAPDSPLFQKLDEMSSQVSEQNNEIGAFLDKESRAGLLEALRDFPLTEDMKNQILKGDITSKNALLAIKQGAPFVPPSFVSRLFQTEAFQRLFENQIRSNWSRSPKALENKEAVDDLYENLSIQTKQLENFLKAALGGTETGSSLSGQARDLHQNLDFMQTLNQMFSYVQIPLKLREQTVHSELFVYTKKGALKKNPQDISILLHLDMEKLGPLDIYLSLQNNQVASKFYLSDKPARNLLKNHIEELSDALLLKGYSLTSEFFVREQSAAPVKEFLEQEGKSSLKARYTFDIRA